MWADNETDVDLLGFSFLVDTLVVALTEPRLLPVTVGLLGDWGSGKSSLMKITRRELTDLGPTPTAPRYLCVHFSPWQHEDYDDIKFALMSAVLEAVAARAGAGQESRVTGLRAFLTGLKRWGRRGGRALASAAPAAVPLWQYTHPDIDPLLLDAAKTGVDALAGQVGAVLAEPDQRGSADGPAVDVPTDAAGFRAQFGALVKSIDDLDAVVVFIDDLDRCLPPTVVDTFEAIRLFLNTPKTAYVVAANQHVVESAIDSMYPELRRPDGTGIGADYLEKMLQLKVSIPALSAPEAETYVNLLLAELRLDDDELFERVLEETEKRRASSTLDVAFNLGVATATLGKDLPDQLVVDLEWAAHIADALGVGLRGNPRQIKRFCNNLLLRQRGAQRRHTTLELPVLAKLMLLEEQHFVDFQRLFAWQLTSPGPIPELAAAEELLREAHPSAATDHAKTVTDRETRADTDVADWVKKPGVRRWLSLQPPLGKIDLRPYFTYARDKLTFGVAVTRLAPHLQELLAKIQSDTPGVRRQACDAIAALPELERTQLVEALTDTITRHPGGQAFTAAIDLADRAKDCLPAVCEALMAVPPVAVGPGRAAAAVQRLPVDDPRVEALLQHWAASDAPSLAALIDKARTARRQSGRR